MGTRTKFKEVVENIADETGWSVYVFEETDDSIEYDFGKYSPAGQDFHIEILLEEPFIDVGSLANELRSRYDDFDCSAEAYIWLDSNGHGKNGAPYDMKDVYEDAEACRANILEFCEAFESAEME